MQLPSTARIRNVIEEARKRHRADIARLDAELALAERLPPDMPPPESIHNFTGCPWLSYNRSDFNVSEWPRLPRRVDVLNYWMRYGVGVSAYHTGTLLIAPISLIKQSENGSFRWHIDETAIEVRFEDYKSHYTTEIALYAYAPCPEGDPLLVRVKVQPFSWTGKRPCLIQKLALNGEPIPGRTERHYPDLHELHRVQWYSERIAASYFFDEERAREFVLPLLGEPVQ